MANRRQRSWQPWRPWMSEDLHRAFAVPSPPLPWAACALTLTALLGALSGPRISAPLAPVEQERDAEAILLFSLAPSMALRDAKGVERIQYARLSAQRLLREHAGQVAALAYGGEAYLVAPLMEEAAALRRRLPDLHPSIVPVQGSNLPAALRMAEEMAALGRSRHDPAIVLLADAVAWRDRDESLAILERMRARVLVLDAANGASPSSPALAHFAQETGGRYHWALGRDLELPEGGVARAEVSASALCALLALGGLLYLMAKWPPQPPGRAALHPAALPALLLAASAPATQAQSPWVPEDPQTLETPLPPPEPGSPRYGGPKSGDLCRLPDWLLGGSWVGWCLLPDERAAAADELRRADTTASLYNLGVASARLGRWEEAIAAWREVLARDPGHDDARHNLDVALSLAGAWEETAAQDPGDAPGRDPPQATPPAAAATVGPEDEEARQRAFAQRPFAQDSDNLLQLRFAWEHRQRWGQRWGQRRTEARQP